MSKWGPDGNSQRSTRNTLHSQLHRKTTQFREIDKCCDLSNSKKDGPEYNNNNLFLQRDVLIARQLDINWLNGCSCCIWYI